MAQFQGKRTDSGIPIHVQAERYTEGDNSDSLESSVCLGEKPELIHGRLELRGTVPVLYVQDVEFLIYQANNLLHMIDYDVNYKNEGAMYLKELRIEAPFI